MLKETMMAAAMLSFVSGAEASPVRYEVDSDHSELGFSVRHMMVSNTKGVFRKFKGTVMLDEQRLERSRVEVTIDAASIDTNVEARDKHLRSGDFFLVSEHPEIRFVSTELARDNKTGRLVIRGNLTIRGVTRPVMLDAEPLSPEVADPWGSLRRGTVATAVINRKEFGLLWNAALDAGGVAVGDEVRLRLEVELMRNNPARQSAAQ